MALSEISLVQPKKNLERILGPNRSKYWRTMRLWYKSQISKDQFNTVAKELLGESNIHVHNEFFLALLLKCQLSSKNSKRVSTPITNGTVVERPTHFARNRPSQARVTGGRIGLASQDKVLPDEDNITSRCLTGAWEENVDIVNSDVVPLISLALQMYLQGILTDSVRICKSYHMSEHRIPHGFNQPHPTQLLQHLPSLISMGKKKSNDEKIITCNNDKHIEKTKITISHLVQALYKLKSKRISLMNIERAQNLQKTEHSNPHVELNNSTLSKILRKEMVVAPTERLLPRLK